jgi:long-chain fatty acid transport protein
MKIRFLMTSALGVLSVAAFSSQAQAAGFYIQEQSVSGLGSAFSGSVTNLHDPSTVYFNPAGMTRLQGSQIQAGTHILVPNAEIENNGSTTVGGGAISGGDGGNPYSPTPVPNAHISHQINDRFWAGISMSAPFGLANKYDGDWFGRYDSIKTELTTIDIQPTVAFKVSDRFSVGGGINVQFADAELTSAASTNGVLEGESKLVGDDWSYGFTLGAQYHLGDTTTLGASYRSAISHTLQGRASVIGAATADFNVEGKADLDLPDIATFGASHQMNDRVTLQGQATWFGWNNFEDITTITEEDFSILGGAITRDAGDVISRLTQNYQTTWAFAAGAEYEYSDSLTLRGGMQFDATPTTDEYRTSRTPDGDRTWLSAGATYDINETLVLDMAATYIWIDDGTIDINRNNSFSAATQTDVIANTDGSVGIFALGLTYKF